jgi:hypothetical protein
MNRGGPSNYEPTMKHTLKGRSLEKITNSNLTCAVNFKMKKGTLYITEYVPSSKSPQIQCDLRKMHFQFIDQQDGTFEFSVTVQSTAVFVIFSPRRCMGNIPWNEN